MPRKAAHDCGKTAAMISLWDWAHVRRRRGDAGCTGFEVAPEQRERDLVVAEPQMLLQLGGLARGRPVFHGRREDPRDAGAGDQGSHLARRRVVVGRGDSRIALGDDRRPGLNLKLLH